LYLSTLKTSVSGAGRAQIKTASIKAGSSLIVHYLHWGPGYAVNVSNHRSRLSVAFVVSSFITLGLAGVEYLYSDGSNPGFPTPDLAYLFLSSFLATFLLLFAIHQLEERGVSEALISITMMGLTIWSWIFLFLDQLPCFLGGNGC